MEANEWTNTDPKYASILVPPTHMYRLEVNKISVLAKVQGRRGNITYTRTNTKGRDLKKSYLEGLNNLEFCRVKESRENITRDVQDWWWFPKKNLEGKFYGMYINHPSNIHGEWYE